MSSQIKSTADAAHSPPCFRLKAGLFPLTLLEIQRLERGSFEQALRDKVAEAPGFFQQTPVILQLDGSCEEGMSLSELVSLCREHGLRPIVLRGGAEALQREALEAGLALMPEGRGRGERSEKTAPETHPEPQPMPVVTPEPPPPAAASPSRVITTPIRSGQQVYAPNGDLIVLSSVSAGAEVLADGNIHIYGPLRGRALAGVRGDGSARIFCQSLEAELISIAGDFKLSDDLRDALWKQAVQISLNEQVLSVEPLS